PSGVGARRTLRTHRAGPIRGACRAGVHAPRIRGWTPGNSGVILLCSVEAGSAEVGRPPYEGVGGDLGAGPDPVFIEKGASMIEVILSENDRLDWGLKQFRRKMLRSGRFKDMKRKRFYEKPSEQRKRKSAEAKRRMLRARRKMAKAR